MKLKKIFNLIISSSLSVFETVGDGENWLGDLTGKEVLGEGKGSPMHGSGILTGRAFPQGDCGEKDAACWALSRSSRSMSCPFACFLLIGVNAPFIFTGLVGVVVFASSSIISFKEKLPLRLLGETTSPQLFGEDGERTFGDVRSNFVR